MTDTITITDAYTVDAATKLSFVDEPAFILSSDAGAVSLTVGGRVTVAAALDGALITGALATGGGSAFVDLLGHSSFKVVSRAGDGQAVGLDFAETSGDFHSRGKLVVKGESATGIQGTALDADNRGTISVSGGSFASAISLGDGADAHNGGQILVKSDGDGFGIRCGAGANVENPGDIAVTASDRAVGVELAGAGTIVNSGQIHAIGQNAIGILMRGGTLDNSGEIRADGGPRGVAIYLEQDSNDPMAVTTIHNTGVIFGGVSEDQKLKSGGVDLLTNDGEIAGSVFTGRGDDILINNGHIGGLISLGLGDDVYDGSQGTSGRIDGFSGNDMLIGGAGNDIMFGDLFGANGDDTLIGGRGSDQLSGDNGADVYVYTAINDSKAGKGDHIISLDNLDKIDLSAIDADHTQDGDQAFHLVSELTGQAGEIAYTYDGSSERTTLAADVDGDGAADMEIVIDGDARWFTTDFGLIL